MLFENAKASNVSSLMSWHPVWCHHSPLSALVPYFDPDINSVSKQPTWSPGHCVCHHQCVTTIIVPLTGIFRYVDPQDTRASLWTKALGHASLPNAAALRGHATQAATPRLGWNLRIGHHLLFWYRGLHWTVLWEHSYAGECHECLSEWSAL